MDSAKRERVESAERAVSLALAASVRLAPRALLDTLLCTVVYASSAPTGHKTAIPVAEVAVWALPESPVSLLEALPLNLSLDPLLQSTQKRK